MQIQSLRQTGGHADIDVRAVCRHRFHGPLPMIVSGLVLGPLKVILGRMEGKRYRTVSVFRQRLLHSAVKYRERVDALLDRIAYWSTNLDTLRQQSGRLQIWIGNLVTLNDERHSLAVKRNEIQPTVIKIFDINRF